MSVVLVPFKAACTEIIRSVWKGRSKTQSGCCWWGWMLLGLANILGLQECLPCVPWWWVGAVCQGLGGRGQQIIVANQSLRKSWFFSLSWLVWRPQEEKMPERNKIIEDVNWIAVFRDWGQHFSNEFAKQMATLFNRSLGKCREKTKNRSFF